MLPTKLGPADGFAVLLLSLGFTIVGLDSKRVAWPSGLRRWFKAPVSSEAWVRIPPLPSYFDSIRHLQEILLYDLEHVQLRWLNGLGV